MKKPKTPKPVRSSGELVKMRGDDSGYTCVCGKTHKYPAHVYEHWSEELTHTCDCGRVSRIQNGVAH